MFTTIGGLWSCDSCICIYGYVVQFYSVIISTSLSAQLIFITLFFQDSLKDKTFEVDSKGNVNLAIEFDVRREENTAMQIK